MCTEMEPGQLHNSQLPGAQKTWGPTSVGPFKQEKERSPDVVQWGTVTKASVTQAYRHVSDPLAMIGRSGKMCIPQPISE